jgi:hypothetical protein
MSDLGVSNDNDHAEINHALLKMMKLELPGLAATAGG